MRRILFWVMLGGTAAALGGLCVAYLNAAVALDDAYQQGRYQRETIETLRGVLEDVSKHADRATITRLVEQRARSADLVKKDAGSLSLNDVIFVFEGEKVSAVRLLQSSGDRREDR